MSKTTSQRVELKDGSGGLNNRDNPSNIRSNQFSTLENWYTDEGGYPGKKVPGADVIQYAPIDPHGFDVDADTIGLWHFDNPDSTAYEMDETPNHLDVFPHNTVPTSYHSTPSVAALFPLGAGLGKSGKNAEPSGISAGVLTLYYDGGSLSGGLAPTFIDDLPEITMETWVKIPSSYSGRPFQVTRGLNKYEITPSGATLMAFCDPRDSGVGSDYPGTVVNGFRIWRDYEIVSAATDTAPGVYKDAGNPYITFTLNTKGVSGTITTIKTASLPTDRMIHVMATYSATTGLLSLYANGSLQSTVQVNGGGNVHAPGVDGNLIMCFLGSYKTNAYEHLVDSFIGLVDEARVSSVVRPDFPYKKPHSIMEKEFARSDGTKQLIVGAGDGLYYTVVDGNWSPIATGLSQTQRWCFLQHGDIVYMCNGVDTPLAWNGTSVKPWGEGVVPPSLSASAAASGLAAGTYKYCHTYVYGNEETGPSTLAEITLLATSQVNVFNIPTRHDNCSAIRVYRTKAGGSSWYLDREIVNDATADYVKMDGPYVAGTPSPYDDSGMDGVEDATLGTGDFLPMTAEVLATRLGNPTIFIENFDRLFLAGFNDTPYGMGWTEPGLPDVRFNTSLVNAHGGKPIIALSKLVGEVQAHKGTGGALVLRGDSPSNWTQLEQLHPNIGCIDHFGITYRTIPASEGGGSDKTLVVFPTQDGFYGYMGYEFFRIDDEINGTFKSLAQSNPTKSAWITTSQAQFEAASILGGSATQNIDASAYSVDGLTEEPGTARIVDQLDYIGLWGRTESFLPTGVGGSKVIAMCKGVGEGVFYFSVDADRNLYRTTDNWQTASIVASLDGLTGTPLLVTDDHRIIEIAYASIGGQQKFWIFTSKSDESGYVALWNQTVGVWENSSMVLAGPYFWQIDVPWYLISSGPVSYRWGVGVLISEGASKFNYGIHGSNPYLNHSQRIPLGIVLGQGVAGYDNNGLNGTILDYHFWGSGGQGIALPAHGPAFISLEGSDFFQASITIRETALWNGGTFRPQAVAKSGKIYFIGSLAEDANLNRPGTLIQIDSSALATTVIASGVFTAMTTDDTNLWFAESYFYGGGTGGTQSRLWKMPMSGTTPVAIGYNSLSVVPLRLSWNASNSTLLYSGKRYDGVHDTWTYKGTVGKIDTSTGVYAELKQLPASNNSGCFPVELVQQTTTPYAAFALMRNFDGSATGAIYKIAAAAASASDVSVFKLASNQGGLGPRSQTLFVANSGAEGGNLWADRIYWADAIDLDDDGTIDQAKPVQLGVPGDWTVIGTFTSELKNLGSVSALGSLNTDFSGDIRFRIANGAVGETPFADTAFIEVTPNQKITTGKTSGAYVQWQAILTWEYSVALATISPHIDFVSIEFFQGNVSVPRILAIHHQGRTRWSVASLGSETNDMELIYQKDNTWTTCPGRRIIGYSSFRGDLVAFEDYTLIKMETGHKWLGNTIIAKAIGAPIFDQESDKYIRFAIVDLMEYQNSLFPTKPGWLKITPVQSGTVMDGLDWYAEIPATGTTPKQRQVNGEMVEFAQGWARVLALQVMTSDDDADHIADPDQYEQIQAIILHMRVSPQRRIITVQ